MIYWIGIIVSFILIELKIFGLEGIAISNFKLSVHQPS